MKKRDEVIKITENECVLVYDADGRMMGSIFHFEGQTISYDEYDLAGSDKMCIRIYNDYLIVNTYWCNRFEVSEVQNLIR